ncbi:MAG: hypothetical protein GY854_01920 [Deltaproteobacteria bacterium]|nr:hypothetical protein [Deltaproteobacteria bacterium]
MAVLVALPKRGRKQRRQTNETHSISSSMVAIDEDDESLSDLPAEPVASPEPPAVFPPRPAQVFYSKRNTEPQPKARFSDSDSYPRDPSSGFIELNPSPKGRHILNDGAIESPSEHRHRETSTPAENRRELGIPAPLEGGAGGSFDFYSPPNFKEEIAKAEKKVAKEEGDFQYHKNTDHGHGIICNKNGRWFVCKLDSMRSCNRKHGGMCRFAKENDKDTLTSDVFF